MNKKLIVVINGPAGVGKDTLIEEYAKKTKNSIYNYSTIDYFKEIAKKDFGWNGIKDEKGRRLLSEIKRISVEYNDFPTELTMKKIRALSEIEYKNDVVMFVHIREQEETKKLINNLLKENYNAKSLYIYTTREIESVKSNNSDDYASDWRNGLNDYNALIVNDDLDCAVDELSKIIDLYM